MLTLKRRQLEQLIEHSRRELPNEACGILAGRHALVERVYEMTNAEPSPENFFMDAREQFKAMKEMRSLGFEMLAIYHSHVASAAFPSSHDVGLALYPDVSYVIVSLKDKAAPHARSFKIKDGKIEEEELRIL